MRGSSLVMRIYLILFFIYLFLPLGIMSAATFNDSRFPTVMPWLGTTTKWFQTLWNDNAMWTALGNSLIVAAGVIVISVPVGIMAALVLGGLNRTARSITYAVMVSPLLTPGVIIGISTLIFWNRLGVSGGLHLAVIGQSSFIIAYVMLLVAARMERFDRTQEEAALDLGASHIQTFRRIILPHLRPAILASCVLAFLQSFENYNTTLFIRGNENTLTTYIANKVRSGVNPSLNALGLVLIVLTVLGAIAYEVLRRREAARSAAAKAAELAAERAEDAAMPERPLAPMAAPA
ncbi:ABC transporter permease [Zavarzinia sp. CC-PAN008]|uniref:ABC transporter permease n=1 Tax=Zavarzinia sp. CC-PAN008 TaxID=3243332 RepID=UPI003F74666D